MLNESKDDIRTWTKICMPQKDKVEPLQIFIQDAVITFSCLYLLSFTFDAEEF